MVRKASITQLIFAITLLYIVSPWFFEKKLLFNELLAFLGLAILAYRKFKAVRDVISLAVVLFLACGLFHAVFALFRIVNLFYYFFYLVFVSLFLFIFYCIYLFIIL